MKVGIVTCLALPKPDEDQQPLLEALRWRGVDSSAVAWDDPLVRWGDFDLCVIRSTWNYYRHAQAFERWLERASSETDLWNGPRVVRWNMHKGYLCDLQAANIATVPTLFVSRGRAEPALAELRALRWSDVVIKPAISAGSYLTRRFGDAQLNDAAHFTREVSADHDMLIQPYLPSVEGYGERSLIWVRGGFTHAVRKSPRFHGGFESVSGEVPIADDERALAEQALHRVRAPLLYARIDIVRGASGEPLIAELELIEPSLFLTRARGAVERFAAAICDVGANSTSGRSARIRVTP